MHGETHGDLTAEQIEDALSGERIGRIGCHAEGRTYIVPIAYAYEADAVYAHSADGLKVRTMRANPNVCFEVEQIVGDDKWRTVIAWGVYEELTGAEEDAAIRLLGKGELVPRPIVYRIRLTEKRGRFERR